MWKKSLFYKISVYMLGFAFMLTANPGLAEVDLGTGLLTDVEVENDAVIVNDNATLHMVLRTKWGYIKGLEGDEGESFPEINYDGSISGSSTSQTRIHLLETIKLENHDTITSRANPVSWQSKIFNHWDGLATAVSAKGDASITVSTTQGSITKTAKEWFSLKEPVEISTGNNQYLIVNTHPIKHRNLYATIWWGKKQQDDRPSVLGLSTDAVSATDVAEETALKDEEHDVLENDTLSSDQKETRIKNIRDQIKNLRDKIRDKIDVRTDLQPNLIDFSGYVKSESHAGIKLVKTMRFEKRHGDKITRRARQGFAWNSYIAGGRDGVLVRLLPNNDAGLDTSFTVHFESDDINFSKTVSLEDLHQDKVIRTEVPVDGSDDTYVLVIGRATSVGRRILQNFRGDKYLVENGIKKLIKGDELDVLHLDNLPVEIVEDEVLDSLAEDEVDIAVANGEIVEDENGTIYAIEDGHKRRITNPGVLTKLRIKAHRIRDVRKGDLTNLPDGNTLDENDKHPNGTLIKRAGETAVWLVDGNKRRVFNNVRVFNKRRLSFDDVIEVTDKEFSDFPWSGPVIYPDGALIKFSDAKVYLIDKGKRRHVESEDDFLGLGLKWEDINGIPDSEVFNYDEGDPIVAEEADDVEVF